MNKAKKKFSIKRSEVWETLMPTYLKVYQHIYMVWYCISNVHFYVQKCLDTAFAKFYPRHLHTCIMEKKADNLITKNQQKNERLLMFQGPMKINF